MEAVGWETEGVEAEEKEAVEAEEKGGVEAEEKEGPAGPVAGVALDLVALGLGVVKVEARVEGVAEAAARCKAPSGKALRESGSYMQYS